MSPPTRDEIQKNSKKKFKKISLKGINDVVDAFSAGTENAKKCTLILTDSDSVKALVISGLEIIGRDNYGVYPLKGRLLNVREATHKQILENQEINNLIKILGLQYKKKYNTKKDMESLRYGKVLIMTNQDQHGFNTKGLFINFIHHNWPELLRQNYLEEFIAPIVKARKRSEQLSFYSLPEFEEWKINTPNHMTYSIKYYNCLGTCTSQEAKEYFSNMKQHCIPFRYSGQKDDDHIVLAFSKNHAKCRKEWITNFMVESKRRKENSLPEIYLHKKDTKFVTFTDFINVELVQFSHANNVRTIPSLVDGEKPCQRKVLYACLKRDDKEDINVERLAGSVEALAAYYHDQQSRYDTIVAMAQNHVGSNNLNFLEPRGQFGTRLTGGKDSARPEHLYTKMSPLTRLIFNKHDDPLLKHEYDDNRKIEPVWYIPILPMILVNGADGVGTGWQTKIPNYNPREIVNNIRCLLNDETPSVMIPWYKNFKGTIEDCGESRYVISGEIAVIGQDKIEITELPVGTWTQNYKENVLEPLLWGSEKMTAVISGYKEYNTDTTVKFVITLKPGQLANLEKEGLHKVFKLQTIISTTSMCAFDEMGCLKKFESAMDILQQFFVFRLSMYQKRKDYIVGMLEAEASKLKNQARFIKEKYSGDLVVENKKRKTIIEELMRRGYNPDPVKEFKHKMQSAEEEGQAEESQDDEESQDESNKKPSDDDKAAIDIKNFDYLLGLSMGKLTNERKTELLRERDAKLTELNILKQKTAADLWREDLDVFMAELDYVEKEEREVPKDAYYSETMPSPLSRRVVPTVSDDIKYRIQRANKSRAYRIRKGFQKQNIADLDDEDEFDIMMNQLTFKAAADESETEYNAKVTTPPKERTQRATKRVVKYSIIDNDSNNSSDTSGELFDDSAIQEKSIVQEKVASSFSEDELPRKRKETSEVLWDRLIGKERSPSPLPSTSKGLGRTEVGESDSDEFVPGKRREHFSSDSSSDA